MLVPLDKPLVEGHRNVDVEENHEKEHDMDTDGPMLRAQKRYSGFICLLWCLVKPIALPSLIGNKKCTHEPQEEKTTVEHNKLYDQSAPHLYTGDNSRTTLIMFSSGI